MNRTEAERIVEALTAHGWLLPTIRKQSKQEVVDIIERAGGQDGTCANPEHNDLGIHPKQPGCALWKPERPCGETAWAKSKELHEAWQAWLEQHGVPISMEFVRLANAVGEFTELARTLPSPPTAEEKN